MRYRLKVFLLLTAVFFGATILWQVVRDRGYSDERQAWAAVRDSVTAGQATLDSLKGVLGRLDEATADGERELTAARENLRRFERGAEGGRLPGPQYRQYERAIAAHNEIVARYNEQLAEMQRVYAEYSTLVDGHNLLVERANTMQRRATQEGYALPEGASP